MSVAAAGPLLALSLTGSPVLAGFVTAASVLPELLLHMPAGLLVDRFDRRKVMWWSQAVRVLFAVITCLSLAFCDSVIILIVMALIDASCAVFYEVAEITTVPDLVSTRSLNAAIGSNEAKLNASMLLGRPLGGALLGVGQLMPWIVTACTSLFPMFGLLAIGLSEHRKRHTFGARALPCLFGLRTVRRDHTPEALGAEAGAGALAAGEPGPVAGEAGPVTDGHAPVAGRALGAVLERLVQDSFSRGVLAVCILANFLFQVIVLLQIYLAQRQGIPTYQVGLMLSFSGIGGVVGAIISPWLLRRRLPWFLHRILPSLLHRKPPYVTLVLVCVLAWIPLAWMAAIPQNPVVGLSIWGLCSMVGAVINVALRAHQVNAFPNGQLGRIIGTTRFLSVGSVALGAFSGGWIIRYLGVHGTAVFVGGMFTAIPVLLLLVLQFGALRSALIDGCRNIWGAVVWAVGAVRRVAVWVWCGVVGVVRRVAARFAKGRNPKPFAGAETQGSAPAEVPMTAGHQ